MALAISVDLNLLFLLLLDRSLEGEFCHPDMPILSVLHSAFCPPPPVGQNPMPQPPPHDASFWQREASHGWMSRFSPIFLLPYGPGRSRLPGGPWPRQSRPGRRSSTQQHYTVQVVQCVRCGGRTVPCRSFLGLGRGLGRARIWG
jgi:hypothetical protein